MKSGVDLGLTGKTALISGSTRGIGLATARAFLREGARIVITGRDALSLEKARGGLARDFGADRVLGICKDMRSADSIDDVIGSTLDAFGGVNVFVGVVGSGTAKGGWDLAEEEWGSVLHTNLLSSMALTRAAMKHFTAHGPGSVVLVSSIAGCEAIGAPVPYGAAKAALQSAVKSLSRLAGPESVRVNAVAPGNILFPGGTWETKLAQRREFFELYIRAEVPLQRFGSPDEIADAVVFLSSDRASFITGVCLVVDGGQTRSFL